MKPVKTWLPKYHSSDEPYNNQRDRKTQSETGKDVTAEVPLERP